MVYTAPKETVRGEQLHVDYRTAIDPSLLRAAKHIYRAYFESRPDYPYRPSGVVVDRYSYRGKVMFRGKPALLPQEVFVPFEQIESDLY